MDAVSIDVSNTEEKILSTEELLMNCFQVMRLGIPELYPDLRGFAQCDGRLLLFIR